MSEAAVCGISPSNTFWMTWSRCSSFLLIVIMSSCAICPSPGHCSTLIPGHLYFGTIGHYHFGVTQENAKKMQENARQSTHAYRHKASVSTMQPRLHWERGS